MTELLLKPKYNCVYCTSFFFQSYAQASLDERGNAKFKYTHRPPLGTTCSHCGPNYAYQDPILCILYVVKEELSHSLYFYNAKLARVMHTHILQNKLIRSALLNTDYRVSTSHIRQDLIKTNAPHYIIWDIVRAFAKQSSAKRAATERLSIDSSYYRLLTRIRTIQVDFTEHPDWESEARKSRLIRFMADPHAR